MCPIEPAGVRVLLDANPIVGEARRGAKRFWTTREIKVVKEHYPQGGVAVCLPLLSGRSATSIYQRAGLLGLQAPGGVPFAKRERLTTTPEIDAAVQRWHANGATREGLQTLIRQTMRPRHWLTLRARRMGLTPPRWRPLPWSEAEDTIMRANASKHSRTIKLALKRAGFDRTETAITVRLKRLRVDRSNDNIYSARDVAELLGVDGKAVAAWIEKGWLSAKREPGPGTVYRIHRKAIRAFIVDNVQAIKLGRVDPHWFVDLLAGAA